MVSVWNRGSWTPRLLTYSQDLGVMLGRRWGRTQEPMPASVMGSEQMSNSLMISPGGKRSVLRPLIPRNLSQEPAWDRRGRWVATGGLGEAGAEGTRW